MRQYPFWLAPVGAFLIAGFLFVCGALLGLPMVNTGWGIVVTGLCMILFPLLFARRRHETRIHTA